MNNFRESKAIQQHDILDIPFDPLTLQMKQPRLEKISTLFKVILLFKGRPQRLLRSQDKAGSTGTSQESIPNETGLLVLQITRGSWSRASINTAGSACCVPVHQGCGNSKCFVSDCISHCTVRPAFFSGLFPPN